MNPPGYPPAKNVTGPGGPRTAVPPSPRARQNQLIVLVVVVVVLVVLVRACSGGENRYEKVAHQLTQAIQSNDLAAAQKLENAETAAEMTRGRFGRATDTMAPLGKIKKVKEVTPPGDAPRTHEFDVTFDKGTVHEKILFDPQDKVFKFAYDAPTAK